MASRYRGESGFRAFFGVEPKAKGTLTRQDDLDALLGRIDQDYEEIAEVLKLAQKSFATQSFPTNRTY